MIVGKEKQFYILYIRQYIYYINEANSLYGYDEPICNDEYLTIASSVDENKFKDIIYKGRRYKKDLSVCFSGFREIIYSKQIDNFNSNMTKKEKLSYLKNYLENNKDEIIKESTSSKKVLTKKGVN